MNELKDNKEIIKTDLDLMSNLLITHGICSDTSPIQQAIGDVYNSSDSESWGYRLFKLNFSLDPHPHVIPMGADCLELYLSIRLKGVYTSKEILNPLAKMEFDIVIEGLDQDANELVAAWHFDKHIPENVDEGEPKFIHPEYHFSFGGRHMWDKAHLNWGASLIMPTPRFAYPPLDGILAIDFVLGNYYKKDKRNKITKLPEYKNMVYRSQLRMWRPYYISIANHWSCQIASNDTMDLGQIMPNLVARPK